VRRRRLRILGLLLLLAVLAVPAGAASPPFLVRYSFDDGLTDTGPDTCTVFRNAKGGPGWFVLGMAVSIRGREV
jgi:hypothetical protein